MQFQADLLESVRSMKANKAGQAIEVEVSEIAEARNVKEVEVRAVDQERIIAPAGAAWDSFFLNGPTVSEDFLNERAFQQQGEHESF